MEELIKELKKHTEELLSELKVLDDKTFFDKPNPDKWSIAEVVAHLYISDAALNKVIIGVSILANRNPNEKTKLIKDAFLNFDKKYNALELLLPKPGINKTKEEMLAKLSSVRSELVTVLEKNDPELLCLEFTHPYLGQMTRRELGYLTLYHSIRHNEQIRKTKEAVC